MEEEEEISSPFWLQSSSNHRRGRRRGPSSSFLLNSGVLLIVLLVLALAFIFITIPSFLSFTSQIKPQSVKKSWDSLNLVLVLFAIVCGFLSRNNTTNNESASSVAITTTPTYEEEDRHYKFSERSESFQKPNPTTPRRFWYDHHDQYNSSDVNRVHNGHNNSYGTLNRLRSFRSHPDLRQEEALWGISSRDDHQWRFYDDTHLYNNSYRSSTSDYYYQQQLQLHQWRRPEQKLEAEAEQERTKEKNVKEKESENNAVDEAKNMGADDATSVVESQKDIIYTPPSPPASSPPPPRRSPSPTPMLPLPRSPSPTPIQPPPPQANKLVRRKVVKRTNPDLGKRERKNEQYQSSTSQPPQHPPVPAVVEEGSAKNEKKRGSATSATKEFLTSLRRNKKKKKQRQKSVENLDSFFNYESSYTLPSSTIPPPPPPPPPFFHNLFSLKKHKAKNIHSVIPTPPPPPPRTQKLSISSASQSRIENLSFTTQKLPLQVKIKNYRNNVEENVGSGNESPLNSIPPPPPLPPFKMPAWKYEVHGDFVRLKSNISDDAEDASSPSDAGGDSTMSPFCPSPDVDTKADNFIARFRAGLRLEKMNSVRGKSNLGPDASPSEGVSPS